MVERRESEMADTAKPDMSCVPYGRKGLYLALTAPLLLVMAAVAVYLGTFHVLLSLLFVLLYLSMSVFQAYCCAYQACPYVGGFCPGVIGILPASLLAKRLYGDELVVKSKAKFQRHVVLASVSWLGLAFFPLFWLTKLSSWLAIGYVLCHVIYTLVFWLTVCPACAIRDICPGGRLHHVFPETELASPRQEG